MVPEYSKLWLEYQQSEYAESIELFNTVGMPQKQTLYSLRLNYCFKSFPRLSFKCGCFILLQMAKIYLTTVSSSAPCREREILAPPTQLAVTQKLANFHPPRGSFWLLAN